MLEKRSLFQVPASALWDFHARPGAFMRLTPPWMDVRVDRITPGIQNGAEVHMRLPMGPFHVPWLARHEQYIEGRQFADRQIKGPMSRWLHVHKIEPRGEHASTLTDSIGYALPLPPFGPMIGGPGAARDLAKTFEFRHWRTAIDVTRHLGFAGSGPLRIVISGSSGLVGSHLVPYLQNAGHTVQRLVRPGSARRAESGSSDIPFDPGSGTLDAASLEGIDAVIHLGGVNLATKPWTTSRMREILESRRNSTRLIAATLAALKRPPSVLLVASGTAGYPDTSPSDPASDERTPLRAGFLSDVVQAWESACEPARRAGIRVVNLRMGPILSAKGGFLQAFARAVKFGFLKRIGPGTQIVPWLSMDDLLGAIEFAVHTSSLHGPVNAVAPARDSLATVLAAIASAVHRPQFVAVPAAPVKLALGGLSEELLGSRAVAPTRLLNAGFTFRLQNVKEAVGAELGDAKVLQSLCNSVTSPA